MIGVRLYGKAPYCVAVIHGGPGAPGSMAPVARELSRHCGVLEPLQSACSIDGEVQELRDVLKVHSRLPVTLIGHSWGAWLGLIFAARHSTMVRKLILVGSGPFEERYATAIARTRRSRLNKEERAQADAITKALDKPGGNDRNALFARFGALMSKADAYDPLPENGEVEVEFREDIYASIWREAAELRRGGELLKMGAQVRCPVLAIHGDYDPHPADGVEKPLSGMVDDFRLVLLEKCGHEPWKERVARDRFYEILKNELEL